MLVSISLSRIFIYCLIKNLDEIPIYGDAFLGFASIKKRFKNSCFDILWIRYLRYAITITTITMINNNNNNVI